MRCGAVRTEGFIMGECSRRYIISSHFFHPTLTRFSPLSTRQPPTPTPPFNLPPPRTLRARASRQTAQANRALERQRSLTGHIVKGLRVHDRNLFRHAAHHRVDHDRRDGGDLGRSRDRLGRRGCTCAAGCHGGHWCRGSNGCCGGRGAEIEVGEGEGGEG